MFMQQLIPKFALFNSPRSKTGRYQFAGRMKGHTDAIHTLDFSYGGKYLASGGKFTGRQSKVPTT
jgi:hypothetical protein